MKEFLKMLKFHHHTEKKEYMDSPLNYVTAHIIGLDYITAHTLDLNYVTGHILDRIYVTAHIKNLFYLTACKIFLNYVTAHICTPNNPLVLSHVPVFMTSMFHDTVSLILSCSRFRSDMSSL